MPVTSWPASTRAGGGHGRVDAAGHGGDDLHRDAASCPRPGPLDGGADRLDQRVDVGGGRGVAEREPQRVRAPSSSQPIASSTCEGWGTPAEQAEPVEHSMPRASSSISSESPSQPGKPRCALPGSRSTGVAVEVGVGHDARHPARPGRRAARPSARRARAGALTACSTARGEAGDRRACRGCRCGCRAPGRRRAAAAVSASSRRSTSAPTPYGPPSLCPVSGQRVDPARGEVDRHARRRPGRRRCAPGCRASSAIATTSSIGCTRADLVVGPHHRDQRDATPGRARRPRAGRRGRAGRGASTGSSSTSAPSCRPSQCSASSTAWCSTGVARIRARRGSASRRAQKRPLTARLSDSVPPEVNTTSPGRQLSAARSSRATPPRPGARAPAGRRAARRGCRRRGGAARHRLDAPRAASAWSRRGRGMPSPPSLRPPGRYGPRRTTGRPGRPTPRRRGPGPARTSAGPARRRPGSAAAARGRWRRPAPRRARCTDALAVASDSCSAEELTPRSPAG